MLASLFISNYALITELKIEFQSGFSVITGETGAGKSIILGALSLICGQRADTKSIKLDAEKCIIEACFAISNYHHLKDFFILNELDYDENTCTIRRELTNTGKSRAFINDTPVGLNIMRDLSNQLIDIHSQHENLLISNASYQLDVVDIIAQNSALLNEYKQQYTLWRNLHSEYKQLQQLISKQTTELDYLQFQYNQLVEANLTENEQQELETEQDTLAHAEDIKTELLTSKALLDEENMTFSLLKETMNAVARIQSYILQGNEWTERLNVTYIELKDIYGEISSFEETVEFNPTRLEWIENRLSELYTLLKKYKVTSVAELISMRNEFEAQLEKIESSDDALIALANQIERAESNLKSTADLLTKSRIDTFPTIENHLIEQLINLGMPNIQFRIKMQNLTDYQEHGNIEVQFLFSANKNRSIQPIAQIASGGELSRLMLAIKSLLANKTELPSIIFDEIDTGVSGEMAHKMAEIMSTMSKDMQVITITHLPQIASKGKEHYRVFKDDTGSQTQTHIQKLNESERIQELAQMLSGKKITQAALSNAKELLNASSSNA